MIAKDRRAVLGEDDLKHLALFRVLSESFNYAKAQYDAGTVGYEAKMHDIKNKINKLRKCKKICKYTQRLLLSYSCVNPS
jgi:hypothetical protein